MRVFCTFISNKALNSSSDKAFSSLFISNNAFYHSSYPTKRFLLLTLYLVGRCTFSFHSLALRRHSYVGFLRLLVLASFYVPLSCQPPWNSFQNMTPSRPARPRPQNKR